MGQFRHFTTDHTATAIEARPEAQRAIADVGANVSAIRGRGIALDGGPNQRA